MTIHPLAIIALAATATTGILSFAATHQHVFATLAAAVLAAHAFL